MTFRVFQVDAQVLEQAKAIGLQDEGLCPGCQIAGRTIRHQVSCLARHSARCSHADGNARCDNYVMWVEGSQVLAIDLIEEIPEDSLPEPKILGRERVLEISRKHGFKVE